MGSLWVANTGCPAGLQASRQRCLSALGHLQRCPLPLRIHTPTACHSCLICRWQAEAKNWAADDRSLCVGTSPGSAAYEAHGCPYRLLPERKIFLIEYCLETGLIAPLEVGGHGWWNECMCRRQSAPSMRVWQPGRGCTLPVPVPVPVCRQQPGAVPVRCQRQPAAVHVRRPCAGGGSQCQMHAALSCVHCRPLSLHRSVLPCWPPGPALPSGCCSTAQHSSPLCHCRGGASR